MVPLPDGLIEKRINNLTPLGIGGSRAVYADSQDDAWVIKVMLRSYCGPNFSEWLIWQTLKAMPGCMGISATKQNYFRLFAECFHISETGKFLVMERMWPLGKSDQQSLANFQNQLPIWVTDRRTKNFGKDSNGVIKVTDYAQIKLEQVL